VVRRTVTVIDWKLVGAWGVLLARVIRAQLIFIYYVCRNREGVKNKMTPCSKYCTETI